MIFFHFLGLTSRTPTAASKLGAVTLRDNASDFFIKCLLSLKFFSRIRSKMGILTILYVFVGTRAKFGVHAL